MSKISKAPNTRTNRSNKRSEATIEPSYRTDNPDNYPSSQPQVENSDIALESIPAILLRRANEHPNRVALRAKYQGQYQDISWQQYVSQTCELAAGLLSLGLERGETVALISSNRPEFAYTDLAVLIAGGITVAIYTNTTPQGIAYILNHSEARFLVVDNEERLTHVLKAINELAHLKHIILMDGERDYPVPPRFRLYTWSSIFQQGQEAINDDPEIIARSMAKLNLKDTAIIIYTSGTTGPPKGAMLSHRNISFICATMESISPDLREPGTFISFLPLPHALERIGCLYYSIFNGGTIGFAERLDTVAQDILAINPTVLYGVPRFFEKIYNGILNAVSTGSWIKRRVFNWAINVGKQVAKRQMRGRPVGLILRLKHWLADRLVFQKIRARLGGQIKHIVSGGAPLSAAISEFFYSVGLPIMEAYGATETAAPATVTRPESLRFGTVGTAIPNVEVKLAEDGEIMIRGAGVCQGYYKDPEATARTFIDGWYYSGDVGRFDEEGNLVITDRKKDIIITSAGKNIAPQNIENLLKTSVYINQAVVCGDKRKYLTALITLNIDPIKAYAAQIGLDSSDLAVFIQDQRIYKLIEQEVANKNRELASYERIKKFKLIATEFTTEGGELTPTLKVKRKVVTEKYQELLDSMYEKEFSSALDD